MKSATHLFVLTLSAALLVAGGACTPLGEKRVTGPFDPKLSRTSYIEDGSLVAMVVGTRPTRYREKRNYIPLEVAIVNKGLESLTVDAEFFTLLDAQGNRYAAVGRDELTKGYGNVDLDRRLGEIGPVVRGHFPSYTQFPSTLTPSFDKPIAQRAQLPRFTFVVDFLYFPRPPEGVRGERFELFLDAPELPDPVFVKFEVEAAP